MAGTTADISNTACDVIIIGGGVIGCATAYNLAKKGRKVCVVGELQNRSYDAKDGTKRYVTEIVAEDVEFLTPRGERDASGAGDYAPRNDRPAPQAPDGFVDIDDDALPF